MYSENMSLPIILQLEQGIILLKKAYSIVSQWYNYKQSAKKERYIIHELFNKIEVDKDKRYLLWQILASGSIGNVTNISIFLSEKGETGIVKALGNYAYKANIQTLCSKQRNGANANPDIANMDLKRYIIFSEPESTEKIHNSILKELTGNSRINARKLYENKSDIYIPATIVLECNDKILLKNNSTDGESRRIINYTYKSKFTKNDYEVNELEHIFPAKDISEQFIYDYRYAFIDILIEKAHKFINIDNEKFKITESVKKATDEYISSSYHFLTFLNDQYEKTNNNIEYVHISEIYDHFKYSDFYLNSSKEERRDKLSLRKMKSFFENNKETMLCYKEKFDKVINGERIRPCDILVGYKMKTKFFLFLNTLFNISYNNKYNHYRHF